MASATPVEVVNLPGKLKSIAEFVNNQQTSGLQLQLLKGQSTIPLSVLKIDSRLFFEVTAEVNSSSLFTSLIEYAEEELKCTCVIAVFQKSRDDQANIKRDLDIVGFKTVPPKNPIVPDMEDLMFMALNIDN